MANEPKNTGLDGRAREKSGRIDRKHPTTKIKHLREHYGSSFAPGWDGDRTLGELLKATKFESLTQYVKHQGHHLLQQDRVPRSDPGSHSERSHASFTISFDPDLSSDQVQGALRAMADYYRACGGIGLELGLESIEVATPEQILV
jgi:hypothetical protein